MFRQLQSVNASIYLALLMGFSALLCFLCIHQGHVWGDDFSLYIAQAKSLLEGTTDNLLQKNIYLTDNSEILEGGPIGPYLYPVGFPLLLSGVYAVKGLDFFAMKIYCSLFFIVALPLIYHLFSAKFKDKKYGLLLTIYIALNFAFLSFMDNVLSDMPFFFSVILGMYLIEKKQLNIGHQLLLSSVIIGSYLIRDIGIVLVPTLMTFLFFNARNSGDNWGSFWKKNAILALPIVICGIFWLTKGFFIQSFNANLMTALKTASPKTVAFNAAYYIYVLGELFGIKNNIIVGLPLMFLFILIAAFGAIKKGKSDAHFIVLIVLTFGLYILFPGRQGLRYLFPIIPFIFYFFMVGFVNLPFQFLQIYKKNSLVALAFYIGLSGIFLSFQFKNIPTNQVTTPEALDVYNWLKVNTLTTDIVAFEEPRILRLMTDRNGFMHHDEAKIINSLATYFIENNKPFRSNKAFTPIYQNKNFIVYKINH